MGISIELAADRTFVVRGLRESVQAQLRALSPAAREWHEVFVISVDPGPSRHPLPMLGSYRVEDGLVRFLPRFPLLDGQRYRARCGEVVATFEIPKPRRTPTEVVRIFPAASLLPENLLRFVIYFSAPMRNDEALASVRLLDADGEEVSGVFLQTLEELWDTSGTRLTLILDPGRVKKGLHAHEALGRALVAGASYRLVIDRAFRDAYGEPLRQGVEKSFQVTREDIDPLDPDTWIITAPAAGTCDPLIIHFPKPMDHLLSALYIHVLGPDGQVLPGAVRLDQGDKCWQFTREEPWTSGCYSVEVDSRLEDIAGNNLQGPFDRPPTPDGSMRPSASPHLMRIFI